MSRWVTNEQVRGVSVVWAGMDMTAQWHRLLGIDAQYGGLECL